MARSGAGVVRCRSHAPREARCLVPSTLGRRFASVVSSDRVGPPRRGWRPPRPRCTSSGLRRRPSGPGRPIRRSGSSFRPTVTPTSSLPRCAACASSRTRYWRCVVVDDASSEDVGAVVEPFRLADRRVELLRHAAKGGLAAARNTGLRHLDTDLVLFLDAGDLLVAGALEDARRCIEPWSGAAAVAGVHARVVEVGEDARKADLRGWRSTSVGAPIDWINYDGASQLAVSPGHGAPGTCRAQRGIRRIAGW